MDIDNLNIKELIHNISGLTFKIGLILVILSALFLFTNLTTEIFDTPKFLILLIFTAVSLIFLTLNFTLRGKVLLSPTFLDIPFLLILATGIVSTFLSSSLYVSLLGNQLKIHGSLISLAVYVLFYFVLVNNLKNTREIKWIFTLTVAAAQILSITTLLAYAGIKIMPAGSAFSVTAILALLIPFVVAQILHNSKPAVKIANAIFLMLMGLTIALTGVQANWIAAFSGFILTIFFIEPGIFKNPGRIKPISLISLIAPVAIIALVAVLSLTPPVGKAENFFYTRAKNLSREIQLPFTHSWKIAITAFRDSPFWGSGPSTYLFDFTTYKPVEFNNEKFWNQRFDSAFNEYLQYLATLGGSGLLALVLLTVLFISRAFKSLKKQFLHPIYNLQLLLSISGITFFVVLVLHTSTLPLWILGIVILASFAKLTQLENTGKNNTAHPDVKSLFLNIAAGAANYNLTRRFIKVNLLPWTLLAVVVVLVITTFFWGTKFVLADYHHKRALNTLAANQGIVAYNEFETARKLNSLNDLYRLDFAQTNFVLANAVAAAKGPTEASPGGSLTEQDKQNIEALLKQAIDESKKAVALSPKSAVNWEILALLYRQISGVTQNSLVFSLDAYGRAILQDPLNPGLRINAGSIYYMLKNYDMAIRFFTDAVNIKPDLPAGYFNLSIALRDKGDLANAQAAAEKALALIEKSSADYKTVSDYLADLKNTVASGSADESTIEPPAVQNNTALGKEELPKVINLSKPEKIATPEAVKKP